MRSFHPLTLRFPLALLALLALFSGCCVNERCECRDQYADNLYFRFSRDSATVGSGGGFRRAELDTVYLVRLPLDSIDRPRRDSVRLTTEVGATGSDFTITQRAPFASNPRKPVAYRYLVRGQAPDTFTVRLTDVQVSGRYETVSACCTCYKNQRKSVRVNGDPILDLRTATGSPDEPVIVELRKP